MSRIAANSKLPSWTVKVWRERLGITNHTPSVFEKIQASSIDLAVRRAMARSERDRITANAPPSTRIMLEVTRDENV